MQEKEISSRQTHTPIFKLESYILESLYILL